VHENEVRHTEVAQWAPDLGHSEFQLNYKGPTLAFWAREQVELDKSTAFRGVS